MAHDARLLAEIVRAGGWQARVTPIENPSLLRRALQKSGLHRWQRRRYALNLFIQSPRPWWIAQAGYNVVVPNQEWFTPYAQAILPKIDAVWCKTREAQRVFGQLDVHTEYLGFTSRDRYRSELVKCRDWRRFLHIGSNSLWKGTQRILDTWLKHPEWPLLTIVSRTARVPVGRSLPDNLVLRTDYVPEEELLAMQHEAGVYLHPAEMEGYGHALAEAMSTGAVVVTTDAGPMNELVTAERGWLVPTDRSEPHHLGVRHFVSEAALESTIESLLCCDTTRLRAMGDAGRAWFETNHRAFERRAVELLGRVPGM